MAENKSLLIWHPGTGAVPAVRATVERLKLNDLGLHGEGLGAFSAFGSLIDCFAGEDDVLRDRFRQDFKKYLTDDDHPSRLHPLAAPVKKPFIDFPSYRVPTEWAHNEFMEWCQTHCGKNDFIEPAGRRWNDYLGNLGCHLVDPSEAFSDEILKRNNGVAGCFSEDHIHFYCDNKLNPYRWVGPINDIQHHEQASLCCTIPVDSAVQDFAGQVLRGEAPGRILLEYDLELELEDLRPETGEQSVYDFYGTNQLEQPMGIVSQTHWNAQHLISGGVLRGRTFSYGQKRFVQQWLEKRYIQPNLQVSLMMNFCERPDCYRLAEFMVAEYNQQPIFFFDPNVSPDVDAGRPFNPFRVDGNGVIPTANDAMNSHVVDGGCSGHFAWTRTAVDVFQQKRFALEEPIVLEGGNCWHWDGVGKQKQALSGILDMTAFYRQSLELGYFPGQRGYWGNRWVGFAGDDPAFVNRNEKHGVEWLGLIFENHGPFRLDLRASRLNLVLENG